MQKSIEICFTLCYNYTNRNRLQKVTKNILSLLIIRNGVDLFYD